MKFLDIFEDLTLYVGGFHIYLNFIGFIGNLYKSSEKEWIVESNVYGPNTLAYILPGNSIIKKSNRASS